jgi:hypothetical protein
MKLMDFLVSHEHTTLYYSKLKIATCFGCTYSHYQAVHTSIIRLYVSEVWKENYLVVAIHQIHLYNLLFFTFLKHTV